MINHHIDALNSPCFFKKATFQIILDGWRSSQKKVISCFLRGSYLFSHHLKPYMGLGAVPRMSQPPSTYLGDLGTEVAST